MGRLQRDCGIDTGLEQVVNMSKMLHFMEMRAEKWLAVKKFIQSQGKCDISQNLLTITIDFLVDLVLKSQCYILAHLCI